MRTRTLAILLGGCTLFALWPVIAWAIARFGWIDERWLDALSSLAFTLPIGLAAAALTLVAHGLRLNTELLDLLELEEDEELVPTGRHELATAAAPAGAVAAPNVVTVSGGTAMASAAPAAAGATEADGEDDKPKRGGKTDVVERKNQGFKDGSQGKKPRKANRMGKTMARRGAYSAKSAVRRTIRDNMRMPRF